MRNKYSSSLVHVLLLTVYMSACSLAVSSWEEATSTISPTHTIQDVNAIQNPTSTVTLVKPSTENPTEDEDLIKISELPTGLFLASMSTTKEKIYIHDIGGSKLGTLLNHSLNGVLDPSNTFLVYESSVFTDSAIELFGYGIALFDMRTDTVIPIDISSVDWGMGIPGDWSLDGEKIVISTLDVSKDIFTRLGYINVKELKAYDINLWEGEATDPEWSPNGDNIAFSSNYFSDEKQISSIFLLDSLCLTESANCKDYVTRIFSDDMTSYYFPTWAPDNRRLAFCCTSLLRDSTNLCVGDIETGEILIVPNSDKNFYNPTWSPDGKWISTSSNGDIFVIRPDGSETRKIAAGEEFLFWILVP